MNRHRPNPAPQLFLAQNDTMEIYTFEDHKTPDKIGYVPLVPKLRLGTSAPKLCFPIAGRASPNRVRSRRRGRGPVAWMELRE